MQFRGVEHDTRPNAEPVISVVFADAPNRDIERTEWHFDVGGKVCRTIANGPGAYRGFTGILEELGEVPAWGFLSEVALTSGWDVFRNGERFDIYRGHTEDVAPSGPQTVYEAIHDLVEAARGVEEWIGDGMPSTAMIRHALDEYPATLPHISDLVLQLRSWEIRTEKG